MDVSEYRWEDSDRKFNDDACEIVDCSPGEQFFKAMLYFESRVERGIIF